jgi:threonine dehydratase
MLRLSKPQRFKGVVCASAGNHAQGVAMACSYLMVEAVIFMPSTTPQQKIHKVTQFGGRFVDIRLFGDTFDDAQSAALQYAESTGATFIPPFDDKDVIAGQGTIGLEILEQMPERIDYLIMPVGGGGLAAGLSVVFHKLSPQTKLIGVEPSGAPSMTEALKNGHPVTLTHIEKFVDGAAVKRVGEQNFSICERSGLRMHTADEGKICNTILSLYNEDAIVVEPAGALAISVLDDLKEEIKGKNVVCIVSGGNNDVNRMEEIRERALLFAGKKHYFLIEFPQRPGALKEFVTDILGEKDDITYFQFAKKNNRENGPAVVGIELNMAEHIGMIKTKLKDKHFDFTYLNENSLLFSQLI